MKSEGVNVIPNSRIKGIKRSSTGRLLVDLSTGVVETDHVVVAVGVEPDSQLAAASNIQVSCSHQYSGKLLPPIFRLAAAFTNIQVSSSHQCSG